MSDPNPLLNLPLGSINLLLPFQNYLRIYLFIYLFIYDTESIIPETFLHGVLTGWDIAGGDSRYGKVLVELRNNTVRVYSLSLERDTPAQ